MDSLHFDHRLWNTELKFFMDELSIFGGRLAEVSSANTDATIKVKVEQFQNRFQIQMFEIEKILKKIKSHESHLADAAKQNVVASDHMLFTDHSDMRKDVEAAGAIQQTIKAEFNRFVADHF